MLFNEAIFQATKKVTSLFLEKGFSYGEMVRQQEVGNGPVNDAIAKVIKEFNAVTEHVETHMALQLSDIYSFGTPEEVKVCFEMRDDFGGDVSSLSDIVANIYKHTPIDVSIQFGKKQARFQIKRYSSEHLKYDETSILSFLEKYFPKYGKDINLIILLQPTNDEAFKHLNFETIHKSLQVLKKKIFVGEVSFVFNENMENLKLLRVFPDFISKKIPLHLFDNKQSQRWRKEWADRVRTHQAAKTSSGFPLSRE